ncbi:Lrp/AsnC family transcriptional regulator [Cucumibacter marinus]|uniref:Lrp/AsnC family transcriptional regulator n=1 Tax=Cucumibacter marinus TaxID=1121252 RepID=UPI00040E63D0|nr:Lrp/AsnC family transcriptional regulator [Cucumibacter marinus]
MSVLDDIDRRILRVLQRDSRLSMIELGEQVGLSASSCHRRVKQLEDRGIITGYSAGLDAAKAGFGMMFLVEVGLTNQSEATLEAFESAVRAAPEILECTLLAGQYDYLLRLVCRDVEDFQHIHRERLSRLPHVARIHSNMAIRIVKPLSGYPV